MSRRGYLETQGGSKRLRFVMPGYDADDPDVPQNKVIFDSNDIGTLSILESGEYEWTSINFTPGLVQVATWSYDFVPLCSFQWKVNVSGWYGCLQVTAPWAEYGSGQVLVANDGIRVAFRYAYSAPAASIKLRWIAYRLAAA